MSQNETNNYESTTFISTCTQKVPMLLRQLYFLPSILKREWKKQEVIERATSKMLRSLLKDVYRINPFYKRKFEGTPPVTTLDDLKMFPFTTKDELRAAFPQDLSRGYTKSACIHESTSGSTGDVLNIYHDLSAYDYYNAISIRAYKGFNYNLRQKIAYVRFEPTRKGFYEYFGFFSRFYVPVHHSPQEQLDLILRYNPHVLSAYPSSLLEIGRLMKEDDLIRPTFIISHSELLTQPMRECLQETFDCPVFNEYSSFEMHYIASECTHHRMHIHMDSNLVEIIKDGEPASPGETGEIVITNLHNRAMPFIRYKTGDFGAFDEDSCTCGRGLPLLKFIEGRADEYLILPSGKRVSPRVFDPLDLIFHRYVSKFQIIQKEREKFIIKVVKGKEYSQAVTDLLMKEAQKCVPESIEVKIIEVGDIERTGRGKFRAVISEVSHD